MATLRLQKITLGFAVLLVAIGIACTPSATPTFNPTTPPSPSFVPSAEPTTVPDIKSPTREEPAKGEEIVIIGIVRENNLSCSVDAACFLRILTNGREVRVIYHFGEYPRCLNETAVDFGLQAMAGDELEVFGRVKAGNEISTCEKMDYYIRKAP